MQSGSNLAKALGPIFGNGPGSGMSVIIAVCGIGGILVGISGYAFRAIRDVQVLLPDQDTSPAEPPVLEEKPQSGQPLPAD